MMSKTVPGKFVQVVICAVLAMAANCFPPVFAQTSPPPPPPPKPAEKYTRYGDPVSKQGVFESIVGGYKVGFPSKPASSTVPYESAFGKAQLTTDSLATAFAHYAVVYTDFPTEMTEKYDLDIRYDMVRNAHEKQLSGRVMSENEFYFGSHYGREYVVENATHTLSVRVFIAGPRMFALLVTTRGKMSTQAESLRAANKARVKGFFDSFQLTRVPDAKEKRVELPNDFGIAVTQNSFSSKFFGMAMKLPRGWHIVQDQTSEMLFELGKDEVRRTDRKLADYISDENTRFILTMSKEDLETSASSAMFFILAERAPFPGFRPESVAETFSKLYLEPSEKVVGTISKANIGGVEFAWMDISDSADGTKRRMYFSNRKGISLELFISYKDKSDLDVVLEAIKSLKFEADQR